MSKTAGPRTETRRVLFEGVELTAGVLDDQSRGWPGCDVWSVASGRLIARCQSAETSLAPRLCASDVRLDGSLLPDARCLSLIHRRLHEAKTSSAIWDADFAMVLAFTASEMASEKAFATEFDDGGLQLLREKAESAGCDRSRPSRADGSDALCLSRRLLLQVSGRPLDEPRNLLRNALVTTGQIGNNDAQPFQLEGRSQQVRDGIGRHVSERSSADLLGDGVFEIGR